ncbi:PDDEXK-like family protein [Pseudomonas panipatensis]|uniref:PDDEXK-like family protein n=1 Tax=Pseudomonas panipatensis TaxID=428992 RepID=UPI0035B3427E
METDAVERLLTEFTLWYDLNQQAKQRYQAQLAPEFRLMEFLHRDEMALSHYLSLLLNPKGQHGQGGLYLSRFIQLLPESLYRPYITEDIAAYTEFNLPNGRRLDIYLKSGSGGLAIENKPWASDQANQLRDYAEYLDGQFPGGQWLLIYLCNGEVSEYSLPKDTPAQLRQRIVALDFYHLASWLEECALHTRALSVRVFVDALAQFVREHINGELRLDNSQELTQLMLRSPANLKAAFSISQHLRQVKQQLWGDFIAYLKQQLAGMRVEVRWNESLLDGKRYSGFGVQFDPQDRYWLRWEFENANVTGLFYGIASVNKPVHQDDHYPRIHKAMSALYHTPHASEGWWPWWTYDTEVGMGQTFPYDWGHDADAWLLLQDRSEAGFAAGVVRMVKRLHDELDLSVLRG